MTNINIQNLSFNDASKLSDISLKAYCDHYQHLWYDDGKWYTERCFSTAIFEKELLDTNTMFFIAYEKKVPLGFMKLNVDAPLRGSESLCCLELERIYLTKAATGKGVGKQMIELAFELACKKNKDIVWLKVMDSSTKPILFYKKMGFEICGTYLLDFQLMKEEFRGMYIMKKGIAKNRKC